MYPLPGTILGNRVGFAWEMRSVSRSVAERSGWTEGSIVRLIGVGLAFSSARSEA
jgi:hypothetical protein